MKKVFCFAKLGYKMAKSNTVLIIVLLGVIGFCGCIIVIMCVVGVVCKLKPTNESNGIESNDDISKSNENNKQHSGNKSISFNMTQRDIANMLANPNSHDKNRDNNVTHSDHSQITSSDNDYIKANKFTTSSSQNTFAHLVQNERGWGSSNNNIYNSNNNNNTAGASNKNNNNKHNNRNHRSSVMPRVLQHINPDNIQFENMIGKGKSAKVFKGKWGNKIVAVKWFRQVILYYIIYIYNILYF